MSAYLSLHSSDCLSSQDCTGLRRGLRFGLEGLGLGSPGYVMISDDHFPRLHPSTYPCLFTTRKILITEGGSPERSGMEG